MYLKLKYNAPADGYCVSTALANLLNDKEIIEIQKEHDFKGMTVSELAAYCNIYLAPMIYGVAIDYSIFEAILKKVRHDVPKNKYVILGAFLAPPAAPPHFVGMAVSKDSVILVDANLGVRRYSYLFTKALYEHFSHCIGIYFQDDIKTRMPMLYDSMSHLFS